MNLPTLVGQPVELTLAHAAPVAGRLFTYDAQSATLVLECAAPSPAARTYRIIKASAITAVSLTPKDNLPPLADVKIAPVNTDALRRALDITCRDLHRIESRKPPIGVGKWGVEIFEALSKTYPTRWSSSTIVLLETIHIKSPYAIDSINASSGTTKEALERVKKVLEGERRRILQARPELKDESEGRGG